MTSIILLEARPLELEVSGVYDGLGEARIMGGPCTARVFDETRAQGHAQLSSFPCRNITVRHV